LDILYEAERQARIDAESNGGYGMSTLNETHIEVLKKTSRTFFIPINFLPPRLKEAVTAAYLCMRAVDEIEDHPQLSSESKIHLLKSISSWLRGNPPSGTVREIGLKDLFLPYQSLLPAVTLRLEEWIQLCPPEVTPNVLNSTTLMSEGMADWVKKDWTILNKEDLDRYTFHVAGLVGLMLSDLWSWFDKTETDRELAVSFGRGLQAVNIIRNREEDSARGVDFFPKGWDLKDMLQYAKDNIALAHLYIEEIESTPILNFCKIPLALADGTLQAIEAGESKLSRGAVNQIVLQVMNAK
jgi:farnesyl-diphosphate farnesyltransferase